MSSTKTGCSTHKRLRVAVVTDYDFLTGGIEVFTRELLTATADEFDYSMVSWSHDGLNVPGVPVAVVSHGDVRILWDALAEADLALVLTSFNIRALAWLTAEYLDSAKVPTVTVVHTSQHSSPDFGGQAEQARKLQLLLNQSASIVAVSQDVAGSLAGIVDDETKLVVIENAGRTLPSTRTSTRTRGRCRVSFIGRPHAQKGFEDFRRLAHELHTTGLKFSANTVSVPVTLADPIDYSSNLSDRDLGRFFDSTDLLVAPYLRADGMPLALLEALSAGVPIVGYDSPGVGALLRRHDQCVVEPQFGHLAAAVRDWATGRLLVVPPTGVDVPTWIQASRAYVELLRSVLVAA